MRTIRLARYAKVKKLSTKKSVSSRSSTINDEKRTLLTEPDEVRKRWNDYIEVLYDKRW